MNILEKKEHFLWIGNYGFFVTDPPEPENVRVWIQKKDGEGMGMQLDQFHEIMDQVWQERF